MRTARWGGGAIGRVGLVVVALGITTTAHAQVVRIVGEDGGIHLTNTPCDPRVARLVPEACPAAPSPSEAVPPLSAAPPTSVRDGPAPIAPAHPDGLVPAVERAASRYGVDPRLVEAVMQVESGGDPGAVSPKGAQGLMQLMPARAAALGIVNAFDPIQNLDAGVRHLRELLARYAGNVTLALAAYNAGEGAVRLHGGVPPYPETRQYVRKVMARYAPAAPVPGRTPSAISRRSVGERSACTGETRQRGARAC